MEQYGTWNHELFFFSSARADLLRLFDLTTISLGCKKTWHGNEHSSTSIYGVINQYHKDVAMKRQSMFVIIYILHMIVHMQDSPEYPSSLQMDSNTQFASSTDCSWESFAFLGCFTMPVYNCTQHIRDTQ